MPTKAATQMTVVDITSMSVWAIRNAACLEEIRRLTRTEAWTK
jgi:hypothetical protein